MAERSFQYDTELRFAKDMAKIATETAMRYFKTELDILVKKDGTPVTIADQTINQLVVDGVKETFPEHGVLGEEESWQADRSKLWVCDPIDGTESFSNADPTFAFSLALVENGKPVVAVAAAPTISETMWAVVGQGTYMNGRKVRVSQRHLNDATMLLPTNIEAIFEAGDVYRLLNAKVRSTNAIHSTVFKGMVIAQGYVDLAVWPNSVHPWDLAAVKLLIEEAGGRFSDISGETFRMDRSHDGGTIMSNDIVYDEVLGILEHYMALYKPDQPS